MSYDPSAALYSEDTSMAAPEQTTKPPSITICPAVLTAGDQSQTRDIPIFRVESTTDDTDAREAASLARKFCHSALSSYMKFYHDSGWAKTCDTKATAGHWQSLAGDISNAVRERYPHVWVDLIKNSIRARDISVEEPLEVLSVTYSDDPSGTIAPSPIWERVSANIEPTLNPTKFLGSLLKDMPELENTGVVQGFLHNLDQRSR